MHTKKEKRNICADFTVRRAVVPLVTGRLLWVMCSCSNLKWSGLTLQFMQGVSPRPGNELGNDCSIGGGCHSRASCRNAGCVGSTLSLSVNRHPARVADLLPLMAA